MSPILERVPEVSAERLGATRLLARFIREAKVDASSRRHATRAFIDTLGVMLAGSKEAGPKKLVGLFEPPLKGLGVRSLWGREFYRREDAALLFGTAGHVLDYDDVAMLSVVHPSAPVLAAILAGAREDLSGRETLDALVIGTEVMIRLGQATGFRHYAIGFHATATMGAIGAAAACARLLRLDETQTAHALAIAASHAGGLRKNFGTLVKSLHVGIAASNGLRAAKLAQAGFEGAIEAIEGEGFLNAFSGAESDRWPENLVLGEPFAIADPGFEQKRYPCCYQLHKMIEATLKLRRAHGLTLADVASARVEMMTGATKPLIHPYPKSGLNALFSGPYAVAAALQDGRINLQSFTDAAVMRADLQGRLHDIDLVETEAQGVGCTQIGEAPVTVTLDMRDGRTLTKTVVVSPGSIKDPLSDEDLAAKWEDCLVRANPIVTAADARILFDKGMMTGSTDTIAFFLAAVRNVARGG